MVDTFSRRRAVAREWHHEQSSAVTSGERPRAAGSRASCGAVRLPGDCLCQALSGIDALRLLRPTVQHLPAGQDFLRLGEVAEEVFVVRDGWVLLYTLLGDGRRQVLKVALRGDLLALGGDTAPLPYTAQTLTETTLCAIGRDRLMDACRIHPGLALRLLEVATRDCGLAYEHLTSVGRCSARERLARLLLEILRRACGAYPGLEASAIPLPLTQSQIGDALGLTAVHVNRMLAGLRDEGIVALSRRTLSVLDQAGLAAAAGGEPG